MEIFANCRAKHITPMLKGGMTKIVNLADLQAVLFSTTCYVPELARV